MATSFNPRLSGAVNHTTLLPLLLLLLLGFTMPWQKACAQQRAGASDWHVPPPKPGVKPAKGTAAKPAALSITDVAAPAAPPAPAADVPQLAAISTTPPKTDQPDQPGVSNADLQLMPMPVAPETPSMPQRTIRDVPMPQRLDVPVPEAPEMPGLPPAPTPGATTTTAKNTLSILPSVSNQVPFLVPQHTPVGSWSTPGIPENDNFRIDASLPGAKDTGNGKTGNRPKKPKK